MRQGTTVVESAVDSRLVTSAPSAEQNIQKVMISERSVVTVTEPSGVINLQFTAERRREGTGAAGAADFTISHEPIH